MNDVDATDSLLLCGYSKTAWEGYFITRMRSLIFPWWHRIFLQAHSGHGQN
jgi:hypothetical protein